MSVLQILSSVGGKKKSKKYKTRKKKSKSKIKKTRRNNKVLKGGNPEPINYNDIMYKDKHVCILKPNVQKGVIIMNRFNQPENMESLCDLGLKTGSQLQKEGMEFGRSVYHPYIFFRAPYRSPDQMNYSNPEAEIISLYEETVLDEDGVVFIRVDPDKTFVFSSEIRTVEFNKTKQNKMLKRSKKTLTDYLRIIKENSSITEKLNPGLRYNLFTSEAKIFPYPRSKSTEWNEYPIHRNSEILVYKPHLTRDYFVRCNK